MALGNFITGKLKYRLPFEFLSFMNFFTILCQKKVRQSPQAWPRQ